jgi:hypothetical protein
VQIYGDFWWNVALQTVTEHHGGGKCLTRVRLRLGVVVTTFVANLVVLSALIYRRAFTSIEDVWWWAIYVIFVVMLAQRAWRLKRRVADLVIVAASRCGLQRVRSAQSKPQATA